MATTVELLAEAEKAYHLLMTGQSLREFVDQNGQRVAYTPANASKLMSYIVQLGGPSWTEAAPITAKPMTVRFR